MAQGLPKGLIATNENVSSEIEREDRVAVEDIAKLWRGSFAVFSTAQMTNANVLFRHSLLGQQRRACRRCGITAGELLLEDLG